VKYPWKWYQPIYAALLLVIMAVVWATLAPLQFGGQSSYVIVAGASMEPVLERGDLVIVRDDYEYKSGDIVTYKHPVIGPIIHRILDRAGDRYILKGDNNDWIDSYQPSDVELIGKLWLHIPNAGDILSQLREPLSLSILTILLGIGVFTSLNKEKGNGRNISMDNQSNQRKPLPRQGRELEGILFLFGVIAFASFLLAIIAFRRPIHKSVMDETPYEFKGIFSYSGDAPSGIYDADTVKTGDPVFFNLTNELSVTYDFSIVSKQVKDSSGTIQLTAELSDPNGWKRTIELQPETDFIGDSISIAGNVDLEDIKQMIHTLEERTEFERQEYRLALTPSVLIEGEIVSEEFHGEFSPRLEFRLDKYQMYPKSTDSEITTLEMFRPSQNGYVQRAAKTPNLISIFTLEIPVQQARLLSVLGLTTTIGGILVLAFKIVSATKSDEISRIEFKYGQLLVNVEQSAIVNGNQKVDVNTMEDLVRLAERSGQMIFHDVQEMNHHYSVHEGAVIYQYKTLEEDHQSQKFDNTVITSEHLKENGRDGKQPIKESPFPSHDDLDGAIEDETEAYDAPSTGTLENPSWWRSVDFKRAILTVSTKSKFLWTKISQNRKGK